MMPNACCRCVNSERRAAPCSIELPGERSARLTFMPTTRKSSPKQTLPEYLNSLPNGTILAMNGIAYMKNVGQDGPYLLVIILGGWAFTRDFTEGTPRSVKILFTLPEKYQQYRPRPNRRNVKR